MKLIYKVLALPTVVMAIASLSGCDKHEIALYSGESAIFFDQQYKGAANETWLEEKRLAHQNYTMVNFNSIASNDSTLRIKIQTTGYVQDYDRPFAIEIMPDSTTATQNVDFEILNPNIFIPAGKDHTYVEVKLNRTERMYEELLQIQLKLIPGEYFTLPFGQEGIGKMPLRYADSEVATQYGMNTDPAFHNIFVTSQLTQPPFWLNMLSGNVYYVGKFSVKKYALMIELCEQKYGWSILDFEVQTMAQEKIGIINHTLQAYLKTNFNKGKDFYILEDDGTLMWVKGCSWPEGVRPEDLVD